MLVTLGFEAINAMSMYENDAGSHASSPTRKQISLSIKSCNKGFKACAAAPGHYIYELINGTSICEVRVIIKRLYSTLKFMVVL